MLGKFGGVRMLLESLTGAVTVAVVVHSPLMAWVVRDDLFEGKKISH